MSIVSIMKKAACDHPSLSPTSVLPTLNGPLFSHQHHSPLIDEVGIAQDGAPMTHQRHSTLNDDAGVVNPDDFDSNVAVKANDLSPFSSPHDRHYGNEGGLFDACSQVYGRDNEIQKIQRAYDRARSRTSEAVFIHGPCGSGKSKLVEGALLEYAVEEDGAFFARGKFDPLQNHSPFSAVMEAFQDIIDVMATRHQDEESDSDLDTVRGAIDDELGEDVRVLGRVIHNLGAMTTSKEIKTNWRGKVDDPYKPSLGYRSKSFTRLQMLCRTFIRLVASTCHPIVLVFDDLQWADDASAELIKALLTDSASTHTLIVCCYRDDEVDPYSLVAKHFRTDEEEFGLQDTDIPLGPMSLTGINELLCGETGLCETTTLSLAEVVCKKTRGNALFVRQYLSSIESEGFIRRNEEGKWTWDLQRIQYETSVPDSVGELLISKVRKLKRRVQHVLKLASFLGTRFQLSILEYIAFNESSASQLSPKGSEREGHIKRMLEEAVKDGLVEKYAKGYKFSHDKVRESLYSMTPEGRDRELIHRNIGYLIAEHANESDTSVESLLQATRHMNLGRHQITEPAKRLELAVINLEAGKISASKLAFAMGVSHFSVGLELVGDRGWSRHYEVTLDLSVSLAEGQFCTSDDDGLKYTVDNILENARTLSDKIRAYFILVDFMAARGRVRAAMKLGFNVMRQLDEPFPSRANSIHVMFELTKARLVVKEMTDEDFLGLPVCTDPAVVAKMKMLSSVGFSAYLSSDYGKVFAMVALRMIRLVCRYGLTTWAPVALAFFGAVNGYLDNHDENFRFGQLAIQMLKLRRVDTKDVEARTLATVFMLTNHWRRPIKEGMVSFRRAFELGMGVGDLDFALIGAVGIVSTVIVIGMPLPEAERIVSEHCRTCAEYKHESALRLCLPGFQYIQKMRRGDRDGGCPAELNGTALQLDKFMRVIEEEDNNSARRILLSHQLRLAYFFESWERLEMLLTTIENRPEPNNLHWTYYTHAFDVGMAYFALYRKLGRLHFRAKARKQLKLLENWVRKGVINCHGMLKLLKAEELSLTGDVVDVLQAYEAATASFVATKTMNHEALALERSSRFLLERQDEDGARRFMEQALTVYEKWGALARKNWLKQEFRSLVAPTSSLSAERRPPAVVKADTITGIDVNLRSASPMSRSNCN